MKTRDVVVVHPGKQHAYEVALALQRAGRLRTFVTGVYYKPSDFPYSWLGYLPLPARAGLLRAVAKRAEPALRADLVRSWPYAELLSRTAGSLGWIHHLSRGRSGYPFVNWAAGFYANRLIGRLEPRPAAVYGFLGGAQAVFARARRLGMTTILDVPIVLDVMETLRHEYQALGLLEPVVSTVSQRVITRELELADWVVAPSQSVADSVRRAGFTGRGMFVVPFGADPSVFTPSSRPRQSSRFRAVFAGRLEVRKGLHYLLEAWRDGRFDGELILAGSPGEGEFVAQMRRQYDGVFVEAGNLIQSELAALMASADVFVLPSLAEGSALVTYQALACGLPCIVTSEAGSVIRDGVEGFVIPARDARALRDRLEILYRDHDLRQRMAAAALERGRLYTWRRYHHQLASVINHVLEDPPCIVEDRRDLRTEHVG